MVSINRFVFSETDQLSIVHKKNEVINLEMTEKGIAVQSQSELQKATPLGSLETMLINTAFGLIDYVKRKHPEMEFDANTEFSIDMQQFARLWKMDKEYVKSKSFDGLIRRAIAKVDSRRLRYNTFPVPGVTRSGTVYSGYFGSLKFFGSKFTGGEIVFAFPKDLIPYLKAPGNFAWYYFENMVSLKDNSNSMMLFEYFTRYKNHHNTSIRVSPREFHIQMTMDELRRYLTISDGYSNTDLYRKVLVPAADFITKQTNSIDALEKCKFERDGTTVSIRKVKEGKELKGVVFEIIFSNREMDRPGAIKILKLSVPLLNTKQIVLFGKKLTSDTDFKNQNIRPDEDDFGFASRVFTELSMNEYIIQYYEFIKKHGYSNKDLEP